MKGTVKWFNPQKGYGFINAEDGTEYFAHQTQIKMDGFRKLDEGDIVEFEIGKGAYDRIQAEKIMPILTLQMMKDRARKEQVYLKETTGIETNGWMIVDRNNFILAGEHGMSLTELNDYFTE